MQFAFPRRVAEYTRILGKANALGINATVCAISSGNDYLKVTKPLLGGNIATFLVNIRERGVYISLGGQFKLVRSEDLIDRLIEYVAQNQLETQFDLRIAVENLDDTPWLTQSQWHEDNWAELRRQYVTCGWQFPAGKDAPECWSVYSNWLSDRAKTPIGKATDDSIVGSSWNIKHAFRKQNEAGLVDEPEFVRGLLWAMQQIVPDGQSLVVCERNRQPMFFSPHMGRPEALSNYWATQVIPLECNFAFVDKKCSFGYFGDYLSGTITAFGDKLISSFFSMDSAMLQRPIRVQPLTLDSWGQLNAKWTALGWKPLSQTESSENIAKIRDLVADIDLDPIVPSRSWNIADITDDDCNESLAVESILLSKLANAMEQSALSDGAWFLWSEPYPISCIEMPFRFSAHDRSSWAIPLISRYSNSYCVRSDFTNGIICLNLAGQLIVFGEELLASLDQYQP